MPNRAFFWIPITILLVVSAISLGVFLNQPKNTGGQLFLSTTTSVENTGLLDMLISKFEDQSTTKVTYTAVGSGNAIQLARDGEVDAVLVHAPNLEEGLINDGFVINKTTLWYNYFVVVGPSSDPANIFAASNVSQAFNKIYEAGTNNGSSTPLATFYSRGDQSGTNEKEILIWQSLGLTPDPQTNWFKETGQGMANTLEIANDDPIGYTISDLGTFATVVKNDANFQMKKLYEGDPLLYNPYSFLIIDKNKTGTNLHTNAAWEFLDFLTLKSTNQLVRDYTIGDIILFTPIGDKP